MADPTVSTVTSPETPNGRHRVPRIFQRIFASLAHRNYRLWFWGQMISLFGTWMQTTAQGFLIYELTHSAAFLGYVGFANGLPSWGLMLYGGVVADRVSRRVLLMVTQTVMMVLAFLLAGLTFAGLVQPWHVLLLTFGLGIANAFDAPARQAFVAELVDQELLTNAIALNSTMFNSATALGPAIAGITYTAFGPGWCFTVNGISFLAVLAALSAMRIDRRHQPRQTESTLKQLREGVTYVVHHPVIRTLILLVAASSLFAISLSTIVPAWAVTILHGDASTSGLLLSSRGAGALIAALAIASMSRKVVRGRVISLGSLALPAALTLFALVTTAIPSFVLIGTVGFFTILVNNLCNALVQSYVPDQLRGRVMGVYTFLFFGGMPVGALFLGMLAEHLGESPAVVITAACSLAVTLLVRYRFPVISTLE
jgi:MFS family permease